MTSRFFISLMKETFLYIHENLFSITCRTHDMAPNEVAYMSGIWTVEGKILRC